jgi:hypothetical protein
MFLHVFDNRDSSHQSAPSPSLCYIATRSHMHTVPSPRPRSSRSHALRYFGFLSVWPDLQFPATRPLGLGLLYVYPRNPVCARRFRSSCFIVYLKIRTKEVSYCVYTPFHHWVQDDDKLAALGGFGLTPNVPAQITTKVGPWLLSCPAFVKSKNGLRHPS